MDSRIRRFVRERAHFTCEYCRIRESQDTFTSFHLDHIAARQHHGGDEPENLAWSCHHCNYHKGTNLASIDPLTGVVVAVFHPRLHVWEDHFEQRANAIYGKTAIGRATIRLLAMNHEHRLEIRSRT